MLTLCQRDRDRLAVLRQVVDGLVRPGRGAELVGLSPRQFRRWCRRHEAEGDKAVIHRLRGRRSNHAISPELKAHVIERVQEPVFKDFGPTLLAEHLWRDPEIGPLSAYTLRLWMIEAGAWKPRHRGARHRNARPRRAAFGELIQWDTSEHAWFEERSAGHQFLIQMHDDATHRLMMARFVARDDGAANRQIAIDYLERWGRPLAFYTDKAGHFGRTTRAASDVPLSERDPEPTDSIIRRALRELNIELILAHSPQAKGRVERNFGTSPDRLVKELRVRGISTYDEANRSSKRSTSRSETSASPWSLPSHKTSIASSRSGLISRASSLRLTHAPSPTTSPSATRVAGSRSPSRRPEESAQVRR